MKRFLLIPSCALLALGALSSCQKEEKSALELTQDLTAELQKVVDYKTAEAAAPRVEVLNKRFQNASVRVLAANDTALVRSAGESGHEGDAYAEALSRLAREIGRVRASVPVVTSDGEVDRDKLVLAVGAANGAGDDAPASLRREKGLSYIHEESAGRETPGTFAEFYGSTKLREALEYKANPAEVSSFQFDSDEDVPAIPAATPVPEEEEEPAAEASAEETPADSSSADASSTDEPSTPAAEEETPTPAATETPAADSDDDDTLPSLDLGDDTSSDSSDTSSEGSSDAVDDLEIEL